MVGGLVAKPVSTKQISKGSLSNESREKLGENITMHEKGLHLISEGKMAIVLLLNEKENWGYICDPDTTSNEATEISSVPLLQKLLSDENFIKVLNSLMRIPLFI